MKKLVYTCLSIITLLLSQGAAQAQSLTNLNFETWATRNGVEAPTNWLTTDDDFAFYNGKPAGTYNFGTVTKTTDVHGGTYAAKLTTTNVTVSGMTGNVPGELILGAKTGVYKYLGLPLGGGPVTVRPTQLQLYYKLSGPAADSAVAIAYLTKTTNGVPTLIGIGYQFLAPATAYTAVTAPINYDPNSSVTPDSVHIILSSGFARNITVGTALFVDDITLGGVALATRAAASTQALLTIAPNPSPSGHFVINSPDQPALAASPWQVLDALGRVVAQQPAQAVPSGQRELDLSALSSGIYLLRLDSKDGTIVRQLTVK